MDKARVQWTKLDKPKGYYVLKQLITRFSCNGPAAAVIACAAASALAVAVPALGAAPATVGGNVAGWVQSAPKLGAAPDDRPVTIAVHLKLTHAAQLKTLVADVSSPASPHYGHYLTAQQFAQRFAPAAADVTAVRALLEHAGMSEVQVGPHGVYVSATATVRELRSTFHVSQDLYSYHGKTLRANKEGPTIPASLAGKVVYIGGLDDSTALRRPFHHSATMGKLTAPAGALSGAAPNLATPDAAKASRVTPPPVAANLPSPYCNTHYGAGALVATLSTAADVYGAAIPWLNCGYTPQQIQAAYGLNKVAKYDGSGVTVAIIDAYASPTMLADGNRYAANHHLKKLKSGENFTQIIPIGIYDVSPDDSCGPYGWWEEESLDVAALHGAAPGANIIYVGSRDCNTSLDIALFNTLYNHVADIVTNSWGITGEAVAPGDTQAYDQALMAGAVQGMTVLFASGDDGDLSLSPMTGLASGSWPATSSYVTGVGGTSLLLEANGKKSEHGWGTYREFLSDVAVHSAKRVTTSGLATTTAFGVTYDDFSFYSGSGGGISLLEPQPAYQAGVVPQVLATSLNLASGYTEPLPFAQRVSPDVAMVADPYTGYLFGETFTIAGDQYADAGCTPFSKTEEYCETGLGGTSLATPLMAGVFAIMNQERAATGEPPVGFANPLLYSFGSGGDGIDLSSAGLNQIVAPPAPLSLLRGYSNNSAELRLVTVNSVPFNLSTAPYPVVVCALPICEGIDEVFNYTSLSSDSVPPTGPGYNDVTGLGVPYVPKLIKEE